MPAQVPENVQHSDVPLPSHPESIAALLRAQAAATPARTAVRWRGPGGKWQDLSWSELDRRRRAIAAGLAREGVARGDRIAIASENRVEMLLLEAAIATLGAVAVPVFSDYGPELLAHCVQDCGARIAACGSALQQQRLEPIARLERLIVLDGHPIAERRAMTVAALEAGHDDAALAAADSHAAGPGDLAYILYTSGTTGRPKGVELTHGNVLSQQAAIGAVWQVGAADVFLSYLPWHHCFGGLFERMMALSRGALLVLDDSRGRDLDRLLANFAEVKPTVYFSVPRVYQALVARAQAQPKVLGQLLHPGLRFVFTAAAPLSAECYRFFEERGVPVHEGWGLTESAPCLTLTRPDRPRVAGVVGWPLPGTEVGFVEVDGAQELVARGPQVMRGYHRDEGASGRALAGGWLRTGDLGEWTPQGLRIHGRADGIFKLQNGEKVQSAAVEARMLAASPLLEQALAVGSGHATVGALAWLSLPAITAWAEQRGLPELPLAEMTRLPELRRAITEALQAANQLETVRYARVRRVALVPEPLSLPTGELTPTLKVVRRVVQEHHKELLAALATGAPHQQVFAVEARDEP